MSTEIIRGNLVNAVGRSMRPVALTIGDGKILSIESLIGPSPDPSLPYILPGFVDAHVHIESSMLIPSAFARMAVVHGTVATVSDPHEIANVCGMEGVRFMIQNGKTVPFKFNFGAPSCVPATRFETAGDAIDPDQVAELLASADVRYLSEMMNFPGAIDGDPEVMAKIEAALKLGKPVDGHAPGLRGKGLETYVSRGISTDHECFTIEEAREKLGLGMKVIIREGSAARNFEALVPLVDEFPGMVMFCSDDKHPDSLEGGHINELCARAVAKGLDVFNIIMAACITPVRHYNLDVGLLEVGDPADFVVAGNLLDFNIIGTYINGYLVAEHGKSLLHHKPLDGDPVNRFQIGMIGVDALAIPASKRGSQPVIGCIDGQLITEKLNLNPALTDGYWTSSIGNDVLKIVVVNRYRQAPIAKAFIHRFGLKEGAIASSVAHDSHNIVAVGVDDASIAKAINLVIEARGGVSCVSAAEEMLLPLPVAGLMSDADGYEVAAAYTRIDNMAKSLGSTLGAPFMSLSFMALLVIPHLKLSDQGLFDGDTFTFV